MKEWFKEYWEVLVLIPIVILIVIFAVFHFNSQFKKHNEKLDKMNEQALHYDANGLFLIIDKNEEMLGLYYGTDLLLYDYTDDLFFLDEEVHECPVLVVE